MWFINYEEFHKFIRWGETQNTKNPWKFWTIEIYSKLMNWVLLEIYEQKENWKTWDEIIMHLEQIINKEEREYFN